ncbi:hydroxypyruvate isomerase family protein [Paracoccus aerodenitrificans]|uniref:hydroxypyruvate isomerase family protein n=1 Tax=Paracoccus aerodenitrificans TaxID=3017781 RepID=UPI0022F0DE18|nr:TIM barrel protein [Paracoccus aerodenitrificans]WBU65432.1 TIM barrel protein [Paracoccus aerodenitrificans]
MARFAANLTLLFNELPILQRFAAAKRVGFKGVEILYPYDMPLRELRQAARRSGLEIVLINCPPPNWAGGPRGFAAVPEAKERFRNDFETTLRTAEELSARHIHVMAGKSSGKSAMDCFVENLKWATERAPHASLTIEPMSQTDMPGYFLSDFDTAVEVIKRVDAPNLGLQFDAYQVHMITGNVVGTWRRYMRYVRHIQIAGAPDRHEPRDCDIDYRDFFRAVDASDYPGWVAAEYKPRTTTEAGLRWMKRPEHAPSATQKNTQKNGAFTGWGFGRANPGGA